MIRKKIFLSRSNVVGNELSGMYSPWVIVNRKAYNTCFLREKSILSTHTIRNFETKYIAKQPHTTRKFHKKFASGEYRSGENEENRRSAYTKNL